jgi:hypothetical protein
VRALRLDLLETRLLPTTALIAEIDSGVDLGNTTDAPYYDLADAYNAYTQQPATADGSNIEDNSNNGGPGGHGTAVANSIVGGIQATMSQPGASTASVEIMPIRVTNNSGGEDDGTFPAVIRGIFYAAYHHASVINISVVFLEQIDNSAYIPNNPDPSYTNQNPTFQDAIDYANAHGAIVVTGAGNDSYDIDSTDPNLNGYLPNHLYPTDNQGPNLIVAASTDPSGNLTSVSNYGPFHVNLGSPANQNATSYAAGNISGIAGVIASLDPGLTPAGLVNLLESTSQKYPQLSGLISTGGVVSPQNAVNAVFTPTVVNPASSSVPVVTGTSTTLSVLGADAAGESSLTYTWSVTGGSGVSFAPNSANGTNAGKTITASFTQQGTYTFTVTITDGPGRTTTSSVIVPVTMVPLAATSLNQDGSDFANINNVATPVPGPDGLEDVHVVLSNLPTGVPITRVVVDRIGGGGHYASDGSPWSWSSVVHQASPSNGQYASTADVYFQPSSSVVDNNQPYAFNIYFAGLSSPVTLFTNVTDAPSVAVPKSVTATSLGQDGHDFANINNVFTPAPGPDGYQDVHVVLSNLPSNLAISHVRVNRIGGGGLYASDGSPWSWSSVVQRSGTAPNQLATTADVYFQPNPNVVDNNQPYAFDIFFVGLVDPVTVYANVTDKPNLLMPSST